MMIASHAARMLKNPGLRAERLLARNVVLEKKIVCHQEKLTKLKEEVQNNKYKARELLIDERAARKYKVE